MQEPSPISAAPQGSAAKTGTHSHAYFEGARSCRHVHAKIWKLRLRAQLEHIRRRRALESVDTLVQFVGFPRSGHSLIGALLDAHGEAVIAHELDAMGLFRKGLPVSQLPGLMAWNSAAFSKHGRWWNGLCYKVPGAQEVAEKSPRVVGDKKGDWAARWSAENPSLVERFQGSSPFICKWILVTRHPLDNVATMSLRQCKLYDQLRMDTASSNAFRAALREAQNDGRIATEASDAMVADYRGLAAAVATMKARIPASHWLEIAYEDFVAAPNAALAEVASFLGLEAASQWLEHASSLVRGSSRNSRDWIHWSEPQRAALAHTIASRDFLQVYADTY